MVAPNNAGQAEANEKGIRVRLVSAGWRAAIATLYIFIMLVLFLTTIGAPPLHESLFQIRSTNPPKEQPPTSLPPSDESRDVPTRPPQRANQVWWAQAADVVVTIFVSLGRGLRGLLDPNTYPTGRAIALVFFGICLSPYPLTVWSSSLLQRHMFDIDALEPPQDYPGHQSDYWSTIQLNAIASWASEITRQKHTYMRANDFAHMFGFTASATLAACLIVALHSGPLPLKDTALPYALTISLSVGVAIAVAFALELGKIAIRLARSDANSRMFARGVQTLLSVIVASFFLPVLFTLVGEQKLAASPMGIVILGAAVGVLGQRALALVTDRAQTALQTTPVSKQNRRDLSNLDGLGDDDIDRLAEEGIESIHSLAFAHTPRLFFNTIYEMPRICDWQDQALLVELLGSDKADTLRKNLGIRGAIGAQALAQWLGTTPMDGPLSKSNVWPEIPATPDQTDGQQHSQLDDLRETVYRSLGFASNQLAQVALTALIRNQTVDTLRIFEVSCIEKASRDNGESIQVSDPNKGRFGGSPTAGGLHLGAKYLRPVGNLYFVISLEVAPDSERTLEDDVTFVLHPTFTPREITVKPVNNVARLDITSFGVFTVGAKADGGKTLLELDLTSVAGATPDFYTR